MKKIKKAVAAKKFGYIRKRIKTWCFEIRYSGNRCYAGGFKTKKSCQEELDKVIVSLKRRKLI